MKLHDYAIFDHDRAKVGRYLGSISVILAGFISQFILLLKNFTGLNFLKSSIPVVVIYFSINYIFNKWVWKLPIFKIPILQGRWIITGKTLEESGNTKYDWDGEINIEQNWKTILIHLKTKSSQSYSYTATLSKIDGIIGGWQLSYSYRNEAEIEYSHELKDHKGFCEIIFNKELSCGEAQYFNSKNRRTFGSISMKKN